MTLAYKARGSWVVDWKSTVIHHLLALLLIDVLPDHLVRDRAAADRKVASCPKVPPPKLLAEAGKLLQQHARTDPFQPLHDLADLLRRSV